MIGTTIATADNITFTASIPPRSLTINTIAAINGDNINIIPINVVI